MLESEAHRYVFRDTDVDRLTELMLLEASEPTLPLDRKAMVSVRPVELAVDAGVFSLHLPDGNSAMVGVTQGNGRITVVSDGAGRPDCLTAAESTVLTAILRREAFGVFYRPALRFRKLRQAAPGYGLEQETDTDLDRYLQPVIEGGQLIVQPRLPGLLPLASPKYSELRKRVEQLDQAPIMQPSPDRTILVISRHKYYRNLTVELIDAECTKSGKLKPPFTRIPPLDLISAATESARAKFYAAIATLQQLTAGSAESIGNALCTVVSENNYRLYYHDNRLGEQLASRTLIPIQAAIAPDTVRLSVRSNDSFYTITGTITLDGKRYNLQELPFKFGYFILLNEVFYLIANPLLLSVIALLNENGGSLLIHSSKFRAFQQQLLDKLADRVPIEYPDLTQGTAQQLAGGGFGKAPDQLIYLSDFGDHVMIIPVMRYGGTEVAVRTEKQVKAVDQDGSDFLVPRNGVLEQQFVSLLIKQHPDLLEQLDNQLYYFYLHKRHFLDEEWFLPTFEAWHEAGIEVFGFNELANNKLNANQVKIDIKIISGLNWFNATYDVRFGKKRASLKKIQAALRNKSRYVMLDDGTRGILPAAWIEKFTQYFHAGEAVDDTVIRFAKTNFETVTALYDASMLDEQAASEIAALRSCIQHLDTMPQVGEPSALQAILRPYQRQGLGWLHFLDECNFGGILADEMGLGKTVQVIAFMLSQREAGRKGTDLVVVPATLIFNWQRELATLAPSLRVLTLYGARRLKTTDGFGDYDVVLTSYTTLLADIRFLKHFMFNYVYLDESQHIKNPESQRYKAVRLLQARNRVAISGTPFENSSFDLYGQLSFACPGLLGSKRYFRDIYGRPIDQFKDRKRRKELQQKIQPFILRRTKQQVADALPEKVILTLYSEMGDAQRKIYDAYEKEFRDFICALSGEELDRSPMYVLRGLTRLRQICNSPALLPDGMLNTAVSAKIELLKEQITDKAPHHKIVVFSQFVSMLHQIEHMLKEIAVPYVSLTGATRQRGQVVDAFQENPTVRVFLVSLKAGGTGLNLTAADVVYLVDPWWNPAVEAQAIDRVHRIGQDKKTTAYRLITPNSVEEKVLLLQAAKQALAGGLVSNDTSFFQGLDRDQLLSLLS